MVKSFCNHYVVEDFYPAEKVIVEDAKENGTEITLEPLNQKLANLAAHDTLGC